MSGIYTITFEKVSVTVAQDLFAVASHASKQCVLLGFELAVAGVAADAGDAQEEMLALRVRSGQTTAGNGGSATTPINNDGSGGAAGFTARANDTTQASAGTIVAHWQGAMNSRVGIEKMFPEAMQPVFGAGRRLTIELIDAPTDAILVSGTATVQEIG